MTKEQLLAIMTTILHNKINLNNPKAEIKHSFFMAKRILDYIELDDETDELKDIKNGC